MALSRGMRFVVEDTIGIETFKEKRSGSQDWWTHMIVDYVSGMTDRYVDVVWEKVNTRFSPPKHRRRG